MEYDDGWLSDARKARDDAELRKQVLWEAAQLVEDYIRDYRGIAEVGDYFEALPGKIRGL